MTSSENEAKVQLDPTALVGKGWHRECFVHPEDPHRCVKIVVSGSNREHKREQRYYKELQRRGISWELLPKCYGVIETNRGQGAVFDLIRDYDGEFSLPLQHYLSSEKLTIRHAGTLAQGLQALRNYLIGQRIITMTLKAKNILFQRVSTDNGKLMLVDNIGNSDFLPVAKYSAGFAEQKMRRKWRRFESLLRDEFRHNAAIETVLKAQVEAPDEK